MIKLLVINHKFHYEMEKLVRIFMPDVKIQVVYEKCDDFHISTSVTDKIEVTIKEVDVFQTPLKIPISDLRTIMPIIAKNTMLKIIVNI